MINPSLRWLNPQVLKGYPYSPDVSEIPVKPGVYVFYRKHGASYEVFYVGKATNLRTRIKAQLNNLKLMEGIRKASNGTRLLAYAEAQIKPGQKAVSVVTTAERMLIRHYVDAGHLLLNVHGTKIRVQTLKNERPPALNKLVPTKLQAEA